MSCGVWKTAGYALVREWWRLRGEAGIQVVWLADDGLDCYVQLVMSDLTTVSHVALLDQYSP